MLKTVSKLSRSLNESIYIILPIVIVFLIRLSQDDLNSLLRLSDPAIVSCIIFGQLAAKFEGLKGYDGENKDNFNLFTNLLRTLATLAVVNYVILLSSSTLSDIWYYFTYLYFVFALIVHILMSQLASNMQDSILAKK
jgi:hypothetical protein